MKFINILTLSLIMFLGVTAMADDSKISKDDAWKKVKAGALFVDVRTPEEYAIHHEGAINIPYDSVKDRIAEFGTDKEKEIVLYCKSGRRAGVAKSVLNEAGFTKVFNAGGYTDLQ
jgi:phage shock protein E